MSADSQQTFGRYVLLRRLAFGGMAEIFLAALRGDEGFEKKVVVKRILPQFSSDPSFVQMFIDEARLSARITHPNVTQVHDFGSVEGLYFIAMEYVDGVDLRRLLKDRGGVPLSPAHTAAIGEHVARGLAHAHGLTDDNGTPLHIVHRDVSPHNIMISRSGEAKLMDFGIARAEARASRTATGTIKGKVAYMAPEQAADRAVDKRCDQFALGLVLWECLTGRRMFQGDSDLEVLRRVMACEVQPVRAWQPSVPAELDGIVLRLLAEDPDDRYADMADVADALGAFRYGLGSAGAVRLSDLIEGAGKAARRTWSLPAEAAAEPVTAALRENSRPGSAPSARPQPAPEPSPAPAWPVPRSLVWALGAVAVAALAITAVLASRTDDASRGPQALLTVTSDPSGAFIAVHGRDTGLRTPAAIPIARAGEEVRLRLALDGYETWEQSLRVQPPAMQVTAVLARRPAVAAPPPAMAPEPSPTAADQAKPRPRAKVAPLDPPATGYSPQSARRGQLSLRSSGPWLEVYLGGRRLGVTPLTRVEVPAGRLTLRLVNAAAQIERTVEVEVPANGEARKTVEF
ncbi:MAG: serine/threonine protein kinase [Deltaproteobacteria bacterium]|nr:serine/threonine protein kinase [Deltaproteobacteria bacterium]